MIKNNQNKYLSFAKKQFSKFVIVLVVISMFTNIFTINQASAYFSDEATIEGNTFTAGTLAFHLNPATDFTPNALNKGDTASYGNTIINDGSLGFQYTIKTTDISGDTDLCNNLILDASLNNTSIYNDSLSNFTSTSTNYTDPSAWNFVVTLPSGVDDTLQDKTCNFKFTFNSWQENLSSTEGFNDTKQINGTINSGHWVAPVNSNVVLNEILPNPEGLDTQQGLQGEWVELYNNGNTSVDLAGWKIKDVAGHEIIISSTNTLNGRTVIGAKGGYLEWVVVFMNADILNNGGDTVSFYDNTGALVDQYTYEGSVNDPNSDSNSTGGASNGNPVGSETSGNEGKSYARLPVDGTGAWVDPIPTPGSSNILVSETEQPIVKAVILKTQSAIIDKDCITTDDVAEPVILDAKTIDTIDQTVTKEDSAEQDATSTDAEVDKTVNNKEVIETKPTTEPEVVDSTKEKVASEEPKKDDSVAETEVVTTTVIEAPVNE
jgi:hypothetical protein